MFYYYTMASKCYTSITLSWNPFHKAYVKLPVRNYHGNQYFGHSVAMVVTYAL